jgi:hypothetical protein
MIGRRVLVSVVATVTAAACVTLPASRTGLDGRQTPGWSAQDQQDFLYGSMGNEFVPERVLRAFFRTYPDLFPGGDLAAFGVLPAPGREWPVGFSRRAVAHLGGQPSIGLNCAGCHLNEFREATQTPGIWLIGPPAAFDVYAFSGALAVAMARTTEPATMVRFLGAYRPDLRGRIATGADAIRAAVAADPMTSKGMAPDSLHAITAAELDADDPAALSRSMLKLLYNMRTALHLPEQLPPPVPTLPGPGRTDAFAVLSVGLLEIPARFDAPVKYGFPWNLDRRTWSHWDGNSRDALSRNIEATLGLGAPTSDGGSLLDITLVKRQTDLTRAIRPPRFPWPIDAAAAARGATHYRARCAACHDDVPEEQRLHVIDALGTDPNRARFFDRTQAERTNAWLGRLKVRGYTPDTSAYRSTGQYRAPELDAAWARAPYLHNGSVRTMWDLLQPPARRPVTFRRGSRVFDASTLGFADDGVFVFDTRISGNSNAGHDYGTDLGDEAKRDLIEFLKTR